jgi:predicted enzyme related to lactoylglutathione lyase
MLVNVDVGDLARGTTFYTEAFDLRVGRRFGAVAVELLGLEAPIYLLHKAAATTAPFAGAPPRSYDRHWTPVHLDFAVDDLEAAVERAERAGAHRESEIETHAWGRIALLADPWGNGFCLLQLSARGYDAVASQP